jgi:hypothetical protein
MRIWQFLVITTKYFCNRLLGHLYLCARAARARTHTHTHLLLLISSSKTSTNILRNPRVRKKKKKNFLFSNMGTLKKSWYAPDPKTYAAIYVRRGRRGRLWTQMKVPGSNLLNDLGRRHHSKSTYKWRKGVAVKVWKKGEVQPLCSAHTGQLPAHAETLSAQKDNLL